MTSVLFFLSTGSHGHVTHSVLISEQLILIFYIQSKLTMSVLNMPCKIKFKFLLDKSVIAILFQTLLYTFNRKHYFGL